MPRTYLTVIVQFDGKPVWARKGAMSDVLARRLTTGQQQAVFSGAADALEKALRESLVERAINGDHPPRALRTETAVADPRPIEPYRAKPAKKPARKKR